MIFKLLVCARQRRTEKARAIIVQYLEDVVAKAELIKEKLYTGPFMKRSDAYHISHASPGLSTTRLKWLLRTNDQGVADWANALPEVQAVLHVNGLMFVTHIPTEHRTTRPCIRSISRLFAKEALITK